MELLKKIRPPPWRTIVPGCLLFLAVVIGYSLWSPGLDVRDGRDDRGHNGIWLAHGWFTTDEWFVRNGKQNQITFFQNKDNIRSLAELLRSHHMTDVFPHLCPVDEHAQLPAVNNQKVEIFLNEFTGFRVMPWVGGPTGPLVRIDNPKWRAKFAGSVSNLFQAHPRLAGIHLNIEPMSSGNAGFLLLLDELRTALPKGKILSIAAYPPPTRFQPDLDIHWTEDYFRQASLRSDQMVVMMYDTALRKPKFYQYLMSNWTQEILSWNENKQVLLGLPAYDDAGMDYHDPKVENLANGLMGIHSGLTHAASSSNYQGIAVYSEWEMNPEKWSFLEQHFLKK